MFNTYKIIIISISSINEASILKILQVNFDHSEMNCLFTTEAIMGQIQEVYRSHFANQRLLKIRFFQKILEDIENEEEQYNLIRKAFLSS